MALFPGVRKHPLDRSHSSRDPGHLVSKRKFEFILKPMSRCGGVFVCFTMCFFGLCEGSNGAYTGHLQQPVLSPELLQGGIQCLEKLSGACARTKSKSTVTLFSLLP